MPHDCVIDPKLLQNISNLTILSLNFLWDGCPATPSSPYRGTPNAAQVKVHEHVTGSVLRMFDRLSDVTARIRPPGGIGRNPSLVASLVEMGPKACTCDAMSFVSDPLRDAVTERGGLFAGVQRQSHGTPRFSGDRCEYARVTLRGLQSGKLRLRTSVNGGGAVFAVVKPSGGQREVWHGRRVSGLAARPPKPAHQPTPACLLDLEASPTQPLYFSKRDAVSYFDSLSAPEIVQGWFGRPSLRASELLEVLGTSYCEALSSYLDASPDVVLSSDSRLYPVACCRPMGFSWSSAIAQDVMLAQVSAVGLRSSHLLADDKPAPDFNVVKECVAVCTDDVMHWSRDVSSAADRLAKLDVQWGRAGILRRPDKDLDWSLSGTAIGCDFDGCGFLDANAGKQIQAMYDTICLLEEGAGSPNAVMQMMGSLQWFDLLARSKLAVYQDIYAFERLPDPDIKKTLPASVRSELELSVALAPFWSADLSRPYLPFLSATDASSSYGFCVSVAGASPSLIRQVSRYAEKRGDYVVLENPDDDGNNVDPKRRLGTPRNINLKTCDFKTVLSIKANNPAHINVLEGEAFLMWLKWLLRSARHHSARAVCLVDSKVILGGVSKGRSPSAPLLRILRKVAAMQLAGNLLVRLIFIPTHCNPADGPSRGIRQRAKMRADRNRVRDGKWKDKASRYKQRLSHEIERSPHSDELRELVGNDPSFWQFHKLRR